MFETNTQYFSSIINCLVIEVGDFYLFYIVIFPVLRLSFPKTGREGRHPTLLMAGLVEEALL